MSPAGGQVSPWHPNLTSTKGPFRGSAGFGVIAVGSWTGRGGIRTRTSQKGQGILSPRRLPFRHSPGRCPQVHDEEPMRRANLDYHRRTSYGVQCRTILRLASPPMPRGPPAACRQCRPRADKCARGTRSKPRRGPAGPVDPPIAHMDNRPCLLASGPSPRIAIRGLRARRERAIGRPIFNKGKITEAQTTESKP